MLQTWLYFGLVHGILGDHAKQADFVHGGNGNEPCFSTTCLEAVFDRWVPAVPFERMEDMPRVAEWFQDRGRLMKRILATTIRLVEYNCEALDSWFLVALSILHETLERFLKDYSKEKCPERFEDDDLWQVSWSVTRARPQRAILEMMTARGWCPRDLALMERDSATIGAIYYYAHMAPRMFWLPHDQCNSEHCVSTTINAATFRLRHVNASCACCPVAMDNSELCKLIDADFLPLVHIVLDATGQVKVELRARKPYERFVALSHVWAEGLGNPFDNALPTCQLRKLYSTLISGQTEGTVMPVWIDTLLVPVRPAASHRKAMSQMRVPYTEADFVLVVDSYLVELDTRDVHAREIFARLQCSTWNQRLWTLQESKLGCRVLFQFADCILELDDLFPREVLVSVPLKPDRALFWGLVHAYEGHTWSRFARDPDLMALSLGPIWSARQSIRRRAVSVPSDEALCLASLLGVEVRPVADASPVERMAVLWQQLSRVPSSLLFSHAPRKLDHPGSRWAPETFLGHTTTRDQVDSWLGPHALARNELGIPSPQGLRVSFPGLSFHPRLHEMEKRFHPSMLGTGLYLTSGADMYFRNAVDGNLLFVVWSTQDTLWTDKPAAKHSALGKTIVLQVPLRTSIGSLGTDGFDDMDFTTTDGLTVDIVDRTSEEQAKVKQGVGISHARVATMPSLAGRVFRAVWDTAESMLAEQNIVYWVLTPSVVDACEERSREVLHKDQQLDEAVTLWRRDKPFPSNKDNARIFGEEVSVFGATLDLLEVEVLGSDTQWCID